MSAAWTLEELKSRLKAKPEVKGWMLVREHTDRRERYFLQDGARVGLDQDRSVAMLDHRIRLMVHLPSKPGRQGEISKKLFTTVALDPQLDDAIRAAQQTDFEAWELPRDLPREVPSRKSCDPGVQEDLERVLTETTREIESTVAELKAKRPNVFFSSSELFVSVHERELHLSSGLVHRSSQSRLYLESAFGASVGSRDEYLHHQWAVGRGDLSVKRIFGEAAERAELISAVEKPEAGTYSVLVDAEVLSTVFHNQMTQLTGANKYLGLPSAEVGGPWVAGAKSGQADLLTVWLDPELEWGADTCGLNDQGLLQKRLCLVENNVVRARAQDAQYGFYLKESATTSRGNLVVEPGTRSHAELIKGAPQVLEILQFSGLFADPHSGTFSSEIRLAKLHDLKTGRARAIGSFRKFHPRVAV